MDYELVVIGGGAPGWPRPPPPPRTGCGWRWYPTLGGDCTFTGCVPSKTLIAAAVQGSTFRDAMELIAGPRRLLRTLGAGQILGATIVAPRAGEMIHEPALAMRTRMFTGRLAQTMGGKHNQFRQKALVRVANWCDGGGKSQAVMGGAA